MFQAVLGGGLSPLKRHLRSSTSLYIIHSMEVENKYQISLITSLVGMSLTRCRSSAARDFCVHHVYVELHATRPTVECGASVHNLSNIL